jgi:pimeloyl-ACP methyl ester carboxylesterase
MTTSSHPFPERVLQLGDDGNLIGIAASPATLAPPASPRAAHYVIVNAGVLHRVGPHRLHVELARRLSASGFYGVRVDLSGIGDSRAVPGALTFWASAAADIRSVMDHQPTASYIIIGLCSGADNALAAALEDSRIKGLVLLDPPAYATRRSKLRKLRRRLGEQGGPIGAMAWMARLLLRRPQRRHAAAAPAAGSQAEPTSSGGRITPPPAEWARQLRQLCDRGVRILCIYSGAYGERYNDAGQIWEWFPDLKGRFDVWYEADSNHVFTSAAIRSRLVAGIDAWCVKAFG